MTPEKKRRMCAGIHRYIPMHGTRRGVRSRLLVAVGAIALVLAMAAWGSAPALASASGPTLALGNARLVNGKVLVDLNSLFGTANAYDGFNAHLRWDPAVFSFSSMDPTGGLFDPGASPATGFCVGPDTTSFDSDGGGVTLGCAGFAGTTASNHLLITVALTPAASGCSAIHLVTYGAPDGGDESSGTYTENAADVTPQTNRYYDTTSDVAGNACTPPSSPGPGPSTGPGGFENALTGGNCTYNLNLNGKVDLADLIIAAKSYQTRPGSQNWNSAADVNADDVDNLSDLIIIAGQYNRVVTQGCMPGYPFYNPGPSWNGALPLGYNVSQYLIFTGAMVYSAGSYSCSGFPALSGWAFKSPSTQEFLSACAAAGNLATLADDIGLWDYAHGLSWTNDVFLGPNDCFSLFSASQSIDTAAGVLYGLFEIATTYAQQHGDRVEFSAVVDDEGYYDVCDSAHTQESQCQTPDVTFFLDYAGPIGPAGARPCEADDEQALSTNGGGPAIPQVYVYTGPRTTSCSIDPWFDYLPNMAGAWPSSIASGYAGVQSYPLGGTQQWPNGATAPFYSSWQANIRWWVCHGAAPLFDFDWSYPGGRG